MNNGSVIAEASPNTVEAVLAMFPPEPVSKASPVASPPLALQEEESKAKRALQNVPADDYDTWIHVGMALQATFPDATAKSLWIEWSRKSPKFEENEIDKHWRSFSDRPGGKTIAYVYWLAKHHEPDWWHQWRTEQDQRNTPSVSSGSAAPGPIARENGLRPPSVSSVSASPGGSPTFRLLHPLPERLLPVPAFDPGLLPEAFRAWVVDIADRVQCPIDFPAIAAVVTYSSVVGRRIGIRPKQHDDWMVVPNLWGGVVGRPGVMKTPGLQEPMNVLRGLERTAKTTFEQEQKDYDAKVIVAKARERLTEKQIKEDLADGGDGLDIARGVIAQAPDAPIRRRFLTNDSTVEKLGEILRDNPSGVLVFRDELVGLLKVLDKEGHEGSRAFYLEAWNGTGPFTFDRIGRGTIDIEAAIVSVLGGIQPGPLSAYLRGAARAGAGDDGLVQRFQLLVYPDVSRNWVNVDRFPLTDAKRKAVAVYEAAAKLDPTLLGARQDAPGQVAYLRFEPAAQAEFDAFRGELEHQVRSGTCELVLEAHLSKYRSLVPSLALLFHLADGDDGDVGIEPLRQAIGFAKYLEGHARRIYGISTGSHQECLAIAEHILNGDLQDGFDARSVYRPNWTYLPDVEAAERGIEELVQLGWLAEETRRTPGRSATVCRINPRIWETHPRPTDRTDRSPSRDENAAEGAPEVTDRTDRSLGTPVAPDATDGRRGGEGDEWSTPIEIVSAARLVLGTIDLDPATNPAAQARIGATRFYTREVNGLLQPWRGATWCNPPYSYPLVEQFVDKLVTEHRSGNVPAALLLTNSQTSAAWFHTATQAASAVCQFRGRIRFLRVDGSPGPSPAHGQTLFYFGVDTHRFDEVFAAYGTITVRDARGAA